MSAQSCETCELRKKYDLAPKSFWGRVWRFHISFCPGWKAYLLSLSAEEQAVLKERYHL